MSAADPQGGQQYWLNGLPVSDLSQSGTGGEKYWKNGVPADALIPFHTANALAVGSGRGQAIALSSKGSPVQVIGSGRGNDRALSIFGVIANPRASDRGAALAVSSSIDAEPITSGRGQTRASSIHGGVSLVRVEDRAATLATAVKADSGQVLATGRAGDTASAISQRSAFVVDGTSTDTSLLTTTGIPAIRVAPETYWKDGLPWSGMSSDLWGQQRFWIDGQPASALVPPFHLATSTVTDGTRGQLRASSIKGAAAQPAMSARGEAAVVFIITANAYITARANTQATSVRGFSAAPTTSGGAEATALSQMGAVANAVAQGAGFLKESAYSVPLPTPAEQTFWQNGVPWRGVIISLAAAGRQKFWLDGLPESVIQPQAPISTHPRIAARAQIDVRCVKDLYAVAPPLSGRGDVRMSHEFIDPTIIPNRYIFWQRGVPYSYVHYHYTAGTQKYWQEGLAFTSIETTPPRASNPSTSGTGAGVAVSAKSASGQASASSAGQANSTLAPRPTTPVTQARGQITASCSKGAAIEVGTTKWATFDTTDAFDAEVPYDGYEVEPLTALSGRGDGQATFRILSERRFVLGRGQTVAESAIDRIALPSISTPVEVNIVSRRGIRAQASTRGQSMSDTRRIGIAKVRHGARGTAEASGRKRANIRRIRLSNRGQTQARTKRHIIDLGSVPHTPFPDLTHHCQPPLNGTTIAGLIQTFLAGHFDSRIMNPSLAHYSGGGVRITTNTRFDRDSGSLPALVIKRLASESHHSVIADASTDADGNPMYVRIESGSHRVFCMAEADGVAEDLAMEVFDALTFMSTVFREQLQFHDFEVVGVGELGVFDDFGHKIGIPVDINYVYESGWIVEPIAPRIKSVELSLV